MRTIIIETDTEYSVDTIANLLRDCEIVCEAREVLPPTEEKIDWFAKNYFDWLHNNNLMGATPFGEMYSAGFRQGVMLYDPKFLNRLYDKQKEQ